MNGWKDRRMDQNLHAEVAHAKAGVTKMNTGSLWPEQD